MADKFLVHSMLFHAFLAMVFLPMLVLYIVSFFLDDESYSTNIGVYIVFFGIWFIRDWSIFRRTQPGIYWFQEFVMMSAFVIFFVLQFLDVNLDVPFILFNPWLGVALVVSFAPVLFYLLLSVLACFKRVRRGNKKPPSTGGRGFLSFFIGTHRMPAERDDFFNDFCGCAFKHTVFRKHSFEPAALGITRGCVTIYCCAGLVVFAIYSLVLIPQAGWSFTNTLISWPSFSVADSYSTFTVVAASVLDGTAPSSFSATIGGAGCTTGPTGNVSILDVPLPFSTWSCDYIPPSFPNFTVTSSDSSVLSLWILLNAFKNDNTFIKNSNLVTQLQFTPPLLLTPNGSVDVVYTAMQFTFGKNVWMGLTAESTFPNNAGSTVFYWNAIQSTYIKQQIETGLKGALQVMGTVGGIFTLIDGIFAFIFGRGLIDTVIGGRSVSPFGMMGLLLRDKLRTEINKQFPHLQEETEQQGIAAFVKEVAIDMDFVVDPDTKTSQDTQDPGKEPMVHISAEPTSTV